MAEVVPTRSSHLFRSRHCDRYRHSLTTRLPDEKLEFRAKLKIGASSRPEDSRSIVQLPSGAEKSEGATR
eukprot:scaffold301_cov243-Pinguiococcus_pyrenoidosus.AAC.80